MIKLIQISAHTPTSVNKNHGCNLIITKVDEDYA